MGSQFDTQFADLPMTALRGKFGRSGCSALSPKNVSASGLTLIFSAGPSEVIAATEMMTSLDASRGTIEVAAADYVPVKGTRFTLDDGTAWTVTSDPVLDAGQYTCPVARLTLDGAGRTRTQGAV